MKYINIFLQIYPDRASKYTAEFRGTTGFHQNQKKLTPFWFTAIFLTVIIVRKRLQH